MPIRIQNRVLSRDAPVFCIAEIGVNHNGDLALALEMIRAAKTSGADAVKFQSYRTEDLVDAAAGMAEYQIQNTGRHETQFAMLKRLELSEADHARLKAEADLQNVVFLSTPHSGLGSVDLLDRIGVPAYKIGSGDLTHLPFLRALALRAKPVLLSTGMASLAEVEEAVATLKGAGCEELALMQCTSEYPCPIGHANLRVLETYRRRFPDLELGFSDHTTSLEAGAVAASLGAVCLEKHFTLDTELPGPDHRASLPPERFQAYVNHVRRFEKDRALPALMDETFLTSIQGSYEKKPTQDESRTALLVRKSIVAAAPIQKDETIREEKLAVMRPGDGLAPREWARLVGRKASRDIAAGKKLSWEDVA